MKVTHVIPMYDDTEGMLRISKWINNLYPIRFDDYEVLIYNDKPSIKSHSAYKIVSKYNKFKIIHGEKEENDLRISLILAAKNAVEKNHDAVIITESDCVPNLSTFIHMLTVFKDPFKKPLASVSAMYNWNNKTCYPTHPHWFKDGNINGKKVYNNIGNVSNVGEAGVPFLFSIWKPEVLALMENEDLPKIFRLDSKFGALVHKKGYHHLRLTAQYSGHHNGGNRSWAKIKKR